MIENIYKELYSKYSFEERINQIEMSKIIEEGINTNTPVLLEAETGSGKTLGYLIPSINYALKEAKNIVISTNTLNLQDQILNKELPLLKEIFGESIKYILIKGRNNYVCKRKLEELVMNSNDNKYIDLINNIKKAPNGDRSEIKYRINNELWNLIKSDKDTTFATKCPYYKSCYFYTMKNKIENCNVFVVNHHILMLDHIIKQEGNAGLIPKYDLVVVDEAHNLENIVRRYYSLTFNFKEVFKNIGQLYSNKVKDIESAGIISKVLYNISNNNVEFFIDDIKEILLSNIDNIYYSLVKLMKYISEVYKKITISGLLAKNIDKLEVSGILEEVFESNLILKKEITRLVNFLEERDDLDQNNLRILLSNIYNNLDTQLNTLQEIFDINFEKYIYWINLENDNVYLVINATPYSISKEFGENFIEKVRKIIMVSATLSVGKSFKYIKNNLGIEDAIEKNIKSDFDYRNNMNIFLPDDIPLPNEKEFNEVASSFILDYVEKNEGKTFVLFTSYKDLMFVSTYLKNSSKKLNVLTQGDLDRMELIKNFKENKNSILLGTDSFWEGVDVQGEALSNVIIYKLPFQVPDDPIVSSICDRLNEIKANSSFIEYQLPYAVLKMKQGVGRLLRSKYDKGNIIILDKRIHKKNYGKTILKSLPDANIEILDIKDILLK
ncbi:ATP-dependent DNA helicase [Streptobacillus felis]|uniref:ATP-dependent DNA helicase n=1 Tax=Streptobacillus felis TaxID=1384509 RepID=A0A7Z0TBY5_9FUSO|nr:ATP-dependent DNA helicase [Streptobacillus felis]NYV27863.1 ATP-dependent DNA helicase [Streptobacillus felis]